MDRSRRNPDREVVLRALSRTFAGRTSQVLQREVQRVLEQSHFKTEGDGRGPGSEVSDPLDLKHRCVRCGNVMPTKTNSRRMYCSRKCLRAEKQDDKNATYQIFRAELIKGRRCQICNGPIPERKFRGAKFCSKKCEKSLDNPAQRLKIMKTCPHCKQAFHPITAGQIHCGHKCAGRAAALAGRNLPPQKYPPRDHGNCEVCGTRFLKKERHTRYCSRQCWFQSQHLLTAKRLDRILGIIPPRRFPLTVERLDRVFKETRPKRLKRPFNWHLTAARLDAMLERVAG
ncbi:hypothetical protein [Paracoccus sp. SY]|uniref:hypothetical protein n=1 Tax=Paracoccus sp. SY TaxID=1330255 RepID=UPI001304B2E7|nr:hypothetical protein [Paracoccus sp. SY]